MWAIQMLSFLKSYLKHKQMVSDAAERKILATSCCALGGGGGQSTFLSSRRFALQELVG